MQIGDSNERFARLAAILANFWFFSGVAASVLYAYFNQGLQDELITKNIYRILPAMSREQLMIQLVPCALAAVALFFYLTPMLQKRAAASVPGFLLTGAFFDVLAHSVYSRFLINESANVFQYRLDTVVGSLLFATSPFVVGMVYGGWLLTTWALARTRSRIMASTH